MEQSHPPPGGAWEVREGDARRQSLGEPPSPSIFPLGKGESWGMAQRCLS